MTYKTLPRPSASNKQIQEYVDAATKGLASLFIMRTEKGWNVYPANQSALATDFMIFSRKDEAVRYAKDRAQAEGGEVYLYNREAGQTIRV